MKKTTDKQGQKTISSKIEDVEAQIAFAEAGELYPHKQHELNEKKGTEKEHVCMEGETSSGICTHSVKVEDVEAQIAFAEAGELYPHDQQKSKAKKGTGKEHVCVEGETSSGLCCE